MYWMKYQYIFIYKNLIGGYDRSEKYIKGR